MGFVQFHGAECHTNDDGTRTYTERGPIYVNSDMIVAFYDHTILAANNQIRVMESDDEIREKVNR